MISSVEHGPYPSRREQAEAFLQTLLRTRERFGRVSFGDALYIAQFSVLLPTFTGIQGQDDARVLGRWLTGGVNIPVTDTERVRRYAPWLTEGVLSSILARLDLTADAGAASVIPTMEQEAKAAAAIAPRRERAEGPFCLSGRPALERFIREELLHVIDNEEAYRRMGVGFPGAVLLYGPPGCGKTYAVDQLAEYLGWPVYRVTSGTIGSKYVHETSKKVSEVFDQAIANAPSVIIIDELEAFLSSRESARGAGEIHMEEVAEFLRRIPDASKNRVLLFGMTNMLDSIDKAILRRGRFDHIIEVGMPSTQEVRSLLEGMLEKIPTTGDLRLDALARRLTGRQIADVAFVVKEAGRLAVRCGRASVDVKLLETACDGLGGDTKPKRRMGFD
ncbi:MAG: ATP-binding protein [Clostridia bacterium]|nr:ATP-binding protein [Clostridia bacterium]